MARGIHQMDLLLTLLGDWEETRAMAGRLARDIEREDVSTAFVRFRNCALATVVNSIDSPDQVSRIRIDCTDATVELTHLYQYTAADWHYTPHRTSNTIINESTGGAPHDVPSSHTAQLASVLRSLRAHTRPDSSGSDARRTLELLAAIYKAAFTGLRVHAGEIDPEDSYHAMHGGGPNRLSPAQPR